MHTLVVMVGVALARKLPGKLSASSTTSTVFSFTFENAFEATQSGVTATAIGFLHFSGNIPFGTLKFDS